MTAIETRPVEWQVHGVRGWYLGLIRRVGRTRWFAWLGMHVLTRLDRWLFPRFHGRLVSAGPPILPLLLLTTTGRLSGRPRATPLVYLADGDAVVVVGSNWGQAQHPAWSSNLLAQPRATIEIEGRRRAVLASLASEAERARLWPRLLALYPPYQTYAERSGRCVRVFVLRPVGEQGADTSDAVVSRADGVAASGRGASTDAWVKLPTQRAPRSANCCASTDAPPASHRRPSPSAPT